MTEAEQVRHAFWLAENKLRQARTEKSRAFWKAQLETLRPVYLRLQTERSQS